MDNIVSQQVPHDSVAEKAVLGAIFIDPEAIALIQKYMPLLHYLPTDSF